MFVLFLLQRFTVKIRTFDLKYDDLNYVSKKNCQYDNFNLELKILGGYFSSISIKPKLDAIFFLSFCQLARRSNYRC